MTAKSNEGGALPRAPRAVSLDGLKWTPVAPPPESVREGLPWVTHEGVLRIGDQSLRCYQLSTGQRVFDSDDVERFFAGPPEGDSGRPPANEIADRVRRDNGED